MKLRVFAGLFILATTSTCLSPPSLSSAIDTVAPVPTAADLPRLAFDESLGAYRVHGGAALSLGATTSIVTFGAAVAHGSLRITPHSGPLAFAAWGPAKEESGALVFASAGGEAALVQRPNATGLKEDIVLTRSLGDALTFTWSLETGADLEAHLEGDGSIGVYRKGSGRPERRYRLPAPVIRLADGSLRADLARFGLDRASDGTLRLSLVARGLGALPYPVSIDPTVIVTTSANFALGGNVESNVDIASDRVKRTTVGGSIGPWAATTNLPTARYGHTTVPYNGFLYFAGGYTGGTQADVRYATINANGTLSTFTNTTAMPVGRNNHSSVAANGYLYIIGGRTAAGVYLNDVIKAPINANGSLGAFSTAGTFTTGRLDHASVVAHGRLYVIGGWSSGTSLSDVQVAPILANGDLGTFTATTSLPAVRSNHNAAVHNGFIYVAGGAGSNAVLFSRIGADGTLGPFISTSTFNVARGDASVVAYGGSLYIYGGYSSTYLNDVQAAPIHADGTLGVFQTMPSYTKARTSQTGFAYNGFLYMTGGDAPSSCADVQFARLEPALPLGPFNFSAFHPTSRARHASIAHNGYLYILGGYSGSYTFLNDVQFAPVSADGAVGSFSATTSFTGARQEFSTVVNNGFLYVIGGYNGTMLLSDVQFAPINANGTLGAFTATSSLSTARNIHASVVHKGFLYVMGGVNGSSLSSVEVARINADGTLGAFATTTSLSTARRGHSSLVHNGNVYAIAGFGTAHLNSVEFAPFLTDGGLGPWTATATLDGGRQGHASVAFDDVLYVLGGAAPAAVTNIQRATLEANGSLSPFSMLSAVTSGMTWDSMALWGRALFSTGGISLFASDQVWGSTFSPLGTVGPSSATSALLSPRDSHTAVTANEFLYVLGGQNDAGFLAEVLAAPVHPSGTLGTFAPTTPLTAARKLHASAVHRDFVYVVGGEDGTGLRSDVHVARALPDGGLSSFAATSSLPTARRGHASASHGGMLYVTGGYDSVNRLTEVQAAPILADGTLGSFSATSSFSTAREGHTTLVYNGHLYVVGGTDGVDRLADLQASPVNADGGLGAFTVAGSLPAGRVGHASAAHNGYFYVVAGNTGALSSEVLRAVIHANGRVGTFMSTTPLPGTRERHAAVAKSGTLYIVGGNDGGFLGDVRTASLRAPTGLGTYSRLLTFPVPVSVDSVTVNGSAVPGTVRLSHRTASDLGELGPTVENGLVSLGAPMTLGLSNVRALWLSYALDDTQAVLSNRDAGNERDLTDFTVNFTAPTPTVMPSSVTLAPRGEQTFVASGGTDAGFTWVVSTNASGASIDAGLYRAGATGNVTDVVTLTDSLGSTATATVTVTAALSLTPFSVALAPRASRTFAATGGSDAGYTWSLSTNNSGGSVSDAGVYTAGTTGNVTDVITVTDALGSTQTGTIAVGPLLALTPDSGILAPKATVLLTAAGGSDAGYSWSLSTNGSGGTVSDAGLYTAGATGNATDVVTVSDSVGSTLSATFTVTAGVSVTPVSVTLAPLATQAFTASGGSDAGFVWTVSTNNSGASISAGGLYTAGATGSVTDVVQATDSLGNTQTASVTVTAAPVPDAGHDAGSIPDAGTPPDSGTAFDAGPVTQDDAGVDAGAVDTDGGSIMSADSGTNPTANSGIAAPSNGGSGSGNAPAGCGCAETSGSSSYWVLFAMAGTIGLRRRSKRLFKV